MLIWIILAIYLVTINLVTYRVWVLDKVRAKRRERRVSEAMLLKLCALGGWPGGIMAAQAFRHKTSKLAFIRKVIFVVFVQVVVVCLAVVLL